MGFLSKHHEDVVTWTFHDGGPASFHLECISGSMKTCEGFGPVVPHTGEHHVTPGSPESFLYDMDSVCI